MPPSIDDSLAKRLTALRRKLSQEESLRKKAAAAAAARETRAVRSPEEILGGYKRRSGAGTAVSFGWEWDDCNRNRDGKETKGKKKEAKLGGVGEVGGSEELGDNEDGKEGGVGVGNQAGSCGLKSDVGGHNQDDDEGEIPIKEEAESTMLDGGERVVVLVARGGGSESGSASGSGNENGKNDSDTSLNHSASTTRVIEGNRDNTLDLAEDHNENDNDLIYQKESEKEIEEEKELHFLSQRFQEVFPNQHKLDGGNEEPSSSSSSSLLPLLPPPPPPYSLPYLASDSINMDDFDIDINDLMESLTVHGGGDDDDDGGDDDDAINGDDNNLKPEWIISENEYKLSKEAEDEIDKLLAEISSSLAISKEQFIGEIDVECFKPFEDQSVDSDCVARRKYSVKVKCEGEENNRDKVEEEEEEEEGQEENSAEDIIKRIEDELAVERQLGINEDEKEESEVKEQGKKADKDHDHDDAEEDGDNEDDEDDELSRRLRALSPLADLPSVPTTAPSKATNTIGFNTIPPPPTQEELDDSDHWCIICLAPAIYKCSGCDGDLYCGPCLFQGHTGPNATLELKRHKWTMYTRPGKRMTLVGS